jgi:hypothetical protein
VPPADEVDLAQGGGAHRVVGVDSAVETEEDGVGLGVDEVDLLQEGHREEGERRGAAVDTSLPGSLPALHLFFSFGFVSFLHVQQWPD